MCCIFIAHVCPSSIFAHRRTLACSVWSSTPTRTCPSTQRTSSRCTGGRRGTRCLHTSTLSRSRHTAVCFKVRRTVALLSPPSHHLFEFQCCIVEQVFIVIIGREVPELMGTGMLLPGICSPRHSDWQRRVQILGVVAAAAL